MEEKKNYLDKNILKNSIFNYWNNICRIEITIDPNMNLTGIDASSAHDGSILLNFDSFEEHLNKKTFWILSIVSFDKIYLKGDWSRCFLGLGDLISIDGLENLDTSEVTNMSSFFSGCSSIETLDLSTWDTSNVKDMSSMFCDCSNLKSLDLSTWDTSSVNDASLMFYRCYFLGKLNLGDFKVSDVSAMFLECHNLRSVQVALSPLLAEIYNNHTEIIFEPIGESYLVNKIKEQNTVLKMKRERKI